MKQFKVYHATDGRMMFGDYEEIKGFNPEDYQHVATLIFPDSPDSGLNSVFHDTNHIDWEWWENQSVSWHKEARSTSCGDVIWEENTGEFHIVCGCGFRTLDN